MTAEKTDKYWGNFNRAQLEGICRKCGKQNKPTIGYFFWCKCGALNPPYYPKEFQELLRNAR